MKKTKNILLWLLLVTICAGMFSGCGGKKDPVTFTVLEVTKYGNVMLDTDFDKMAEAGFEIGDIITVDVGGTTYDMPIGTDYSDVDSGSCICRFDIEDNEVCLSINSGSFAAEAGIAEKETITEDPGYRWNIAIETVTLVLKEKQGYADEYKVRKLQRSEERSDYPDLTDEAFANFRAVNVTGMKENVLYRSCTPVEPVLGRYTYAMAAMEAAGIKTVLNLDDSVEDMTGYETYADSYYSTCNIFNAEMDYNFGSEDFAAKVKQCVLFINSNEGPYLIHCKEGKDRTGLLCALLEFYAGATYDEVVADYMQTYLNFYGVTEGSETYDLVLNTCFMKNISLMLGTEKLSSENTQTLATDYLKAAGLTDADLATLSRKLCR